jgi:hypothetical protein
MTKIRQPGTFDEACNALKVLYGPDACADAIERSVSLVNQFADDASASLPNVAQAVKLDALHVKATGDAPPLLTLMQEKLAELVGPVDHTPAPLSQRLCDLGKEVGDVYAEATSAQSDGKITSRERAAILKQCQDVEMIIRKIKRDLAV